MFKDDYSYDDLLIGFSVVAAVMAFVGAAGYDIYLASTQWMLVAALLAIWAIYWRMCKKK